MRRGVPGLVAILALAAMDWLMVAASTKPSLKDIPATQRTRAKLLAQVERGVGSQRSVQAPNRT
jgi:hypothetical protein